MEVNGWPVLARSQLGNKLGSFITPAQGWGHHIQTQARPQRRYKYEPQQQTQNHSFMQDNQMPGQMDAAQVASMYHGSENANQKSIVQRRQAPFLTRKAGQGMTTYYTKLQV